jgi:hypothetical protein
MVVAYDEALSFKWRKSCYDSYAHALSRVHTSNVLMIIPGTISLETSKWYLIYNIELLIFQPEASDT